MSDDVIRLVPKAEREAALEKEVEEVSNALIDEARDAAHQEAVDQLSLASRLLERRRCRGLVIAAIIEEANGTTAMFTSIPERIDGCFTAAVAGAVSHASWRLHESMESVESLEMPEGVRE